MDHMREENLEERILELFRNESMTTVVLAGKPGIGKSWMAKKVSVRALKEDIFDLSLWVYLSVKQKERDLYQSLADQLSMYSTFTEVEIDASEESADNMSEEEELVRLQNRIFTRLSKNKLLLILDDEGKKMSTEDDEIRNLLQFLSGNTSKVLITSVNENIRHKANGRKKVIELKPLSPERSLSLLQQKTGGKVFEIAEAKATLEEFLSSNTELTPTEVIIIAKLLSSHPHNSGLEILRKLLEDLHENKNNLALTLTSSEYNKVPSGIFADFNCLVSHCLYDQGAMYYSELIAYWVMEGYLGDINCIDEAYEKGHEILMELIDLHVLKRVDPNYLYIENVVLDLKDCHHHGFEDKGSLGLAKVLADVHKSHGIGEVVQTNGMIVTPRAKRKPGNRYTLMLDGNCLCREDLENFLEDEQLQVLCLFCSRIKCMPPVSAMKLLGVLILRGCDFLENINSIKELRMLTVLEVSNAKSLTGLPDDIFAHQTKLQSLNLSDLRIEELPISAYKLTKIEWLILRGCANIKRLRSMKKWKRLVVLDLSGALSFKNFAETSLKSLQKLQFLDLSNTKIHFLPFLSLAELTHLSASGCRNLSRLPSIYSLGKLQFLDLSGAGIKEIQNHSFQSNVSLKILNLSSTSILKLPSSICSHHLYLNDCYNIEKISCLESPENIEVLDLSGASNLIDIDVQFFKMMINLRILNLSRTKVKVLPPLSDSQTLRELLLSDCIDLVKLPNLSSLCKLEVLDLSGCRALTELEYKTFGQLTRLQRLDLSETSLKSLPDLSSLSNLKELNCRSLSSITRADFLEHMNALQILDLSETQIHKVPHMLCLQSLTYLSLRNCRHIESLSNLEHFTRLEILDLSGTSLKHLPSLKGLRNLRRLLLKDCLNLKELAGFNICDLSGVVIRDLPYGISELTQLEQLALPKMQYIEGDRSKDKACSVKVLNECHWAISCLKGKVLESKRLSLSLSGSEFIDLLEKNPLLWNKSFKHFHFSVHPIQLQNGVGGLYFHREEYPFRDIYLPSMNFPHLEGQFRVLEIHDFHTFPGGVEHVLSRANYIFLLDNWFVKSLADLGVENLKVMKSCWIARCQNMETLMHADSVEDFVELGENLEMLWISYALTLKNLYCGNLQGDCFQNLKYLYLDCCPGLSSMFPQSNFLQKIEILHIKFCDGMKILFENYEKHTLRNLHKLYLWELPELEVIDCCMPSLQVLEVGTCPMLKHVLPSTCIPENLKVVNVQYCDTLCTLVEGMTEENCKLSSLERVKLWGLPELTNIGIDLASLRGSNIKDCPKLQIPETYLRPAF